MNKIALLIATAALEKSAVVKQDAETGQWILWTKDGKRKLGTHPTAEAAYAQEYAIKKSQEKRATVKSAAFDDADWQKRAQEENAAFDRVVAGWPEGEDKELAKKGHGVRYGSCGCRIGSCRCSQQHKPIHLDIPCKECAAKQEKSAAEMVRKPQRVTYSNHCPHCDFEFQEKCYPRMKKNGVDVEDRMAAWRSGDYDEHCPECDGIIERSQEKKADMGWLTEEQQAEFNAKELAAARQDPDYVKKFDGTRRGTWPEVQYALGVLKREQEKSASFEKQALRPIAERMRRLRDRRGECHTCGKPNQEGRVCDCGETIKSASFDYTTPYWKAVVPSFGHTPSKAGPMSLGEWCERIGNVASGPARVIPFNPVTRKLEDPMEKGASVMSRLDYALRSAKEAATPLTREELLERGACCGNGCKNCPYPIKKQASIAAHIRRAINQTHTHPTPAQRTAGNYAKGELLFRPGLPIKIENPEGTTRRGTDKNGKSWSSVLKCTYGYFKGTCGKDGDAVDVFIGPDPESDIVAVIDQMIDGKFDEHKVLVGVKTESDARHLYLANYQKGWKCGPITMTSIDGLKEWLKNGDTKKPFAGQQKEAAWWHREQRASSPDQTGGLLGLPRQVGHLLRVTFSKDWGTRSPQPKQEKPRERK